MATTQPDVNPALPAEDLCLATHPFRGVVRWIYAIAGVVILIAVLWCVWAMVASRRLKAQIDAITVLHQPFLANDFASARSDASDRAAEMWRQAFASLPANDSAPSNSNLQFKNYPPFPPAWDQMENQSIVLNVKVFELAHAAAVIAAADRGDGASSANSLDYNRARETANVLGDAILHAHLHRNDALAIEHIEELLQLASAQARDGTTIGELVAAGIRALCMQRLLAIAPDLNVNSVPRTQIKSLIASVNDEAEENRHRIASVDLQRMSEHQALEGEKKLRWLIGPMIDLSEARLLQQRRVDRLAAEAPSEWEATQVYNSISTPLMGANSGSFSHPDSSGSPQAHWAGVYEDLFLPLFRITDIHWRVTAERRVAAVSLAIQLYRADHGRWPDSLPELVPEYLPAVPSDPFLPEPALIGYVIRKNALPGGIDRPMLYFDLSADAQTAVLPPEPSFGWMWSRDSQGPQWRDLSRWTPVPAPPIPSSGPGMPPGGP